ncbi:MAG TPA: Fur family transcriptional regulator [Bacillota bacterium]|nr:Fur family transcriptional regulator [Bacillota bacterium]
MSTSDIYGLKDRLKEFGYKFTDQRKAILDVLIAYSGDHLSTEEVYTRVKEKHPEMGIATVYRTLMLLEKLELVCKLDLGDGFSRYELVKLNEDHRHHHLVCSCCKSVTEVEEDLLEALEQQILQKNKFLVKDHRVMFYGLCENCRQKAD